MRGAAVLVGHRPAEPESGLGLYRAPQIVDDHLAEHPELMAIAAHPQFTWLGDTTPVTQVADTVGALVDAAGGQVLPLVLYAIPGRDNGQYSAGGFPHQNAYLGWVRAVAAAIGTAPATIVLEPDALGHGLSLPPVARAERSATIRRALTILAGCGGTRVYVDASMWVPVRSMAPEMSRVLHPDTAGFAINVSNYQTTADCYRYGDRLARALGRAHYVIDTSRNGNGPLGNEWCNPPGRALGTPPRPAGWRHAACDGLVWVKRPGLSDGTCHGAPPAGVFSVDLARALVHNVRETP